MIRTSLTHPLRVDAIPVDAGQLGLTFCPGKHGTSLNGAPWARDLDTDLRALRDWGADLVVTLIEQDEFELLRVPDLGERVIAQGMSWVHLPIRDVDVPATPFFFRWPEVRADLLARLEAGGRVVVHCRGGLGRAGLVAALLLIETGSEAETAIRTVRAARPGAIETRAQERYVLNYRPGTSHKDSHGKPSH
jgi:ADP-ribosyl-[dinitrogen reductase] hydrolase